MCIRDRFQPERSYTQKETQELVHELIDSLSDEQRLCILMYHPVSYTHLILGKATSAAGIPPQIVPLGIVRMFSSSAATGLLLDIFKEFGTDSPVGLMAGLMLSSTESVFYCMSVYFGSVGIQKTRYTLAGALVATLAGMAASVWIVTCVM